MGDCRHDFTAARCGQVGEKRRDNLTAYIGEGISVEEEKWGATVALPQEFYGFGASFSTEDEKPEGAGKDAGAPGAFSK